METNEKDTNYGKAMEMSHCGYVWISDAGAPNYCPNCGHEKDDFEENKLQQTKD